MRLTRLKMAGALPSAAMAYNVRLPMYKSEFAALRTNTEESPIVSLICLLSEREKHTEDSAIDNMVQAFDGEFFRSHDERTGSSAGLQPKSPSACECELSVRNMCTLALVAVNRSGSLEGTMRPITNTPPTYVEM